MKNSVLINGISEMSSIGYTPNQIKRAYNFGNIGNGKGITVSIIDFFGNPYIQQNLDIFSREFSIRNTRINIYGKAVNNDFDFGAYIEPCVDTQWVHAVSPLANLNVIRAESYTVNGAIRAVERALEVGTDIMLMTFQSEFSEEYLKYTDIFTGDCVFIASAGDYGAQVNFPSCVPSCISVGGTRMEISEKGERLSEETVWSGTGGGICTYYNIPEYQEKMNGIYELTKGKRGVPDVSSLGDPDTGVSVYHSSISDKFGWYRCGGTSVSASIVAGIIANVLSSNTDGIMHSRILEEIYNLAGGTAYTNQRNKFYDVRIGNNGRYEALRGYDLCTGLGSLINL